jgi:hypothetical protein
MHSLYQEGHAVEQHDACNLEFSQLWVFSLVSWDVIRHYQVDKYYISEGYAAFILGINLEDFDSRNIK